MLAMYADIMLNVIIEYDHDNSNYVLCTYNIQQFLATSYNVISQIIYT